MTRFTKEWLVDSSERVAATFVEAAAGTIPAALVVGAKIDSPTLSSLGWGCLTAGIAAAAAQIKTIAATFLKGGTSTPAGLVELPDPTDHPSADR